MRALLSLLFSIAISVLALLMLWRVYVRWCHKYLGSAAAAADQQSAEPLLGRAVLSKLRSWSIDDAHQMDVTWGPEAAPMVHAFPHTSGWRRAAT